MPAAPALPKSPMGGPAGPGASPATSPGAGAGSEAAAIADIKAAIPLLTKSLNSFPLGDKRRAALLNALRALETNFAKSDTDNLTQAAGHRIVQAGRMGQGLDGHNVVPPGMMLGGPSPMQQPGGGPGGPGM